MLDVSQKMIPDVWFQDLKSLFTGPSEPHPILWHCGTHMTKASMAAEQ